MRGFLAASPEEQGLVTKRRSLRRPWTVASRRSHTRMLPRVRASWKLTKAWIRAQSTQLWAMAVQPL